MHHRDGGIVMEARQQRFLIGFSCRGYPAAAPFMFRTLWLLAAKAAKAVTVILVILLYFFTKNAQEFQSGIHRNVDVGCLAVTKMQKNIVQTLKQDMPS